MDVKPSTEPNDSALKESNVQTNTVEEVVENNSDLDRKLNSAITRALKPLKSTLEALKAENNELKQNLPKKVVESAADADMRFELNQIKAEREAEKAEQLRLKEESQTIKKRDSVKSELLNQGFTTDIAEILLDAFEHRKLVEFNDNKELVFKQKDGSKLSLSKGVEVFAQTDLAKKLKSVVPPKTVSAPSQLTNKYETVFQKLKR
jgi:hypothetical protein